MENYCNLNLIGEGGFGKVYSARRKYTAQKVAIKFIRKNKLKRGKTKKELNSLREEILILKKLKHPNIILLLDWFESENDFGIVTEIAQGELFDLLEEDKKFPPKEIKGIAIQMAQALNYLHSNKILHRDLKPQNILICSNGIIKLCDFGFARVVTQSTQMLTSIKGTPLYMAPELIEEKPYNYNVDLWSFGIILYELYQGEPPFYTNKLSSLIALIKNNEVKYPKNMDRDLQSFLQGILIKNPKKRMKWNEIWAHPFLKKSEKQQKIHENYQLTYNHWLNTLGTWIIDFQDFQFQKETSFQNTSFISSINDNQGSQNDVLNLINQMLVIDENEKQYYKDILNILQIIQKKQDENKFQEISLKTWQILISYFQEIQSKEYKLQYLHLYSNKLSKNLFKILENLNNDNCIDNQTIYSILYYCLFLSQQNVILDQGVKNFIKINENLEINNQKECIQFLKICEIIIESLFYDLCEGNKYIVQIMNSKLFENSINSKIIETDWIQNENILELLKKLISPIKKDYLQISFLQKQNYSIQDNEINLNILQNYEKFEDYINYIVFGLLFENNWLINIQLNNVHQISLIYRSIIYSNECLKEILLQEHIISQFIEMAINFSGYQEDIQIQLCIIFTELNKQQLLIEIPIKELQKSVFETNSYNLKNAFLFYQNSLLTYDNIDQLAITQEGQNLKFTPYMLKMIKFAKKLFISTQKKQNKTNFYRAEFLKGIFPIFGYYDSQIKFFRKLLFFCVKKVNPQASDLIIEYILNFTQDNFQQNVFTLQSQLNQQFNLSLKGLVDFLSFQCELNQTAKNYSLFIKDLCIQNAFNNYLILIDKNSLGSFFNWPFYLGGEGILIPIIQQTIVKIMEIIIDVLENKNDEKQVTKIMDQIISFPNFTQNLIIYYKDLIEQQKEGNQKNVKLSLLIKILKKEDSEKIIIKDFYQYNGIELIIQNNGLQYNQPNENCLNENLFILIKVTLVYQAQNIIEKYPELQIIENLSYLLNSKNYQIREKTLILIGNMVKFSSYICSSLQKINIIKILKVLTQDPNENVRKASCKVLSSITQQTNQFHDKITKFIPQLCLMIYDKKEIVRRGALIMVKVFMKDQVNLRPALMQEQIAMKLYELWKHEKSYRYINIIFKDKSVYDINKKFIQIERYNINHVRNSRCQE